MSGGGDAPIHIRPATAEDRPFMYGMAPRLTGVARFRWRSEAEIAAFQRDYMEAALERPPEGALTVLAEDRDGTPVGFLHAEPQVDPFGGPPAGYISLLAVAEAAEGRGVAGLLLTAAEEWARTAGFRLLALDVFASNAQARDWYARRGFGEETLRLVRPVQP